MHQTKLIQLFKCFSRREIKQFDNFLQSPYFNKNELLLRFYRLLVAHHPKMESGKLAREVVYARLFSASPYRDKPIRDLTSEVFKLAKTFLSHEELSKDSLEAGELRHRWFSTHNLEKLTEAELESRSLLLAGTAPRNVSYYHHQWKYDLHKFETTAAQLKGLEYKITKDLDLLTHVHSLNRHYLVNSFANYHYLFAMKRIYNFSFDESLLQHVEALALPCINKGDAVIDVCYNIHMLMQTMDEKYFYELKARLFEKDKMLPNHIMTEACIALENYTERKIRGGEEKFANEAWQIFRFELDNKLFLEQGEMGKNFFYNVVIRGIEANEIDWVDNFTETHKEYLPEKYREHWYSHARAQVLFARKKYQEALRLALSFNLQLIDLILARGLVCRAQYELNMFEELQVTLQTIPYHLKNEHITDERRLHFQLFISMLRQLAELKANFSQEKLIQLSKQVDDEKRLMNRRWFLNKINELKNGSVRNNVIK